MGNVFNLFVNPIKLNIILIHILEFINVKQGGTELVKHK